MVSIVPVRIEAIGFMLVKLVYIKLKQGGF